MITLVPRASLWIGRQNLIICFNSCNFKLHMAHQRRLSSFSSDDEEENKNKSKEKMADAANANGDYYTGSITCKAGRNTNTTLYYVDYSKTSNDGNGLLPDAKNDLLCGSQKAKADLVAIDLDLKTMGAETAKLLSEPTNEDTAMSLEMNGNEVTALREEVESCSGLKGNEKLTKKLKKRIEFMSTHWRSRKKKCKDFLIMMEVSKTL